MNTFDVRIYAIWRRRGRRRPFEVRWHAAARAWSRSFTTRALADGYRAELAVAARHGAEFSPVTGNRRAGPLHRRSPRPGSSTPPGTRR